MDAVFVYKEYDDDEAYGEEIVEVYRNRADAEAKLQKRVGEYFNISPEKIFVSGFALPEGAEVYEDYVSVPTNKGATIYWVVDEVKVQ